MDFTELFVDVDDFTKGFEVELERYRLVDDRSRRRREGQLSGSEIMTLLIAFQTSNFREFQTLLPVSADPSPTRLPRLGQLCALRAPDPARHDAAVCVSGHPLFWEPPPASASSTRPR